ncbi:TPA: hypothetical protein ICA47_004376 [Escherichia coli]|nr:hypothetical protein [Escherichia coli]
MRIINNLITLLCIGGGILSTEGKATSCIGYYKNFIIPSTGDWKKVEDQFEKTKISGIVSWGSGKGTALYKGPKNGVPSGNYSTYSIALPKFVTLNDAKLSVSINNKTPHNVATNQNYFAWLIKTENDGCRQLRNDNVWFTIEGTRMSSGKITILLQGEGIKSGHYEFKLPYTISWGVDMHEAESERIQGPWKEIDPGSSTTGFFNISFDVDNSCNLTDNVLNFNYGNIAANNVNKRKLGIQTKISCKRPAKLSLSLTPEIVDLKNGIVAKLRTVDTSGHNIKNIDVFPKTFSIFDVESVLEVRNKIQEGDFSGGAALTLTYQ